MESYNLKTASTYLNNLLLARGLLRDGKPVEFAHPSRGEGGKEATMSHIINLVHDLILKRDRDQEHRESIASTLRTLRAESARQTAMIEKMQTRNDDLARQLSLAQSQERSARAALRTAESTARSLREEMVRLKTTVQQVRTSCANDVRKRDVQIQRLKTHLTSQQRGNKTGLVGASITINPGATGLGTVAGGMRDDTLDIDDPEYSLKQETTEFLTQLSQSLSDENDNLIGLVRTTITTLKELQGMPEMQRHDQDDQLSTVGEEDESTRSGMLQSLPASYDTLASDLDTVLENLRNLLTNPNFVSVEEVESREEEIMRLRAGWEKMETRLRQAFALMETWRKRMVDGGDTINLDELSRGLVLGQGLETVNKEDISLIIEPDEDEGVSSGFDDLDEGDNLQDSPSPVLDDVPERSSGSDMFNLKLQPDPPALKESNGNAKSPIKSPRKVAFSASIPNTPSQMEDENAGRPAVDSVGAETDPAKSPLAKERRSRDDRTPQHTRKRLSSPSAHPEERSPKLTVQEKLRAAQTEAEAAAVAESLQVNTAKGKQHAAAGVENERKQRRVNRSPMKTRISGRPKRRKSTLTPEELDNLLLGG